MGEMKQVNIRIPKETKETWDEATEEYGSMTRLIETSVRSELRGDNTQSTESQSAASSEMMEDVAAAIDSLDNTVRDMDKRLTAMRDTIESKGPDYSFRAAVRETVPIVESKASSEYYAEQGLTAEQIAARLHADESDVSEALDTLQREGEVQAITGGNPPDTLYVRTEVM